MNTNPDRTSNTDVIFLPAKAEQNMGVPDGQTAATAADDATQMPDSTDESEVEAYPS